MFQRDRRSFPEIEESLLEFWQNSKIFKKSISSRKEAKTFSFYDGPPFATGLPHYGHILAGTIKDVVARYKTMQGYHVPRRFGWDCHGLPVENEIEKLHNVSGAVAIEAFGIDKFNEECRSIVLRYTAEWEKTVNRMGRWVEFDNTYRTMDINFMESVWWVFGRLWDKDLVYEGFKVMAYSPKLGTPISNFEANLNYREVDDPSLTVKFALKDFDAKLLVWTTTPWTLPSNLAVAVANDETYLVIRDGKSQEKLIIAKARLSSYYKEAGAYEVLEEIQGKSLVGRSYTPLFSYFADHKNAFQVLAGDFVEMTEGTGIVHMAPAFGEDDFYLCKQADIEPVCPIDENCQFTDEVADYKGLFVKDADKDIARKLKQEDKVFKQATCKHRYPFCWRTDLPLIYRAVSTWFVSVEKIKEKISQNNEEIHWVPGHIQKGRFGKWLENARDWAISRNRYWGTPIPIWRSEDGDIKVLGSVKELEEKTGAKITDLHRHFIDDLTFEENGKVYKRIPEVFDCWFESGSMPYAQNHFPFENEELTKENFPADFIAEGLDQTRGWFYTLNVIATALYDRPAFKNVIVNGIVLAEDGQKMSKRLKNYPEPGAVIDKYGADAIRLYLLNSGVVRAEDMSFSERGVEGILKQILLPLFNSYSFLATYAEIYDWKPTADCYAAPDADIDRWILSKLHGLIEEVEKGMDRYELDAAVKPLVGFIEAMTNWYIRRSRSRFWAEEDTSDRREAFETLYTVLLSLVKLLAPIIPFMSEMIYRELRREEMPISVHLTDFPTFDQRRRDLKLELEMDKTQIIVNMGHSLRKEHRLKVRQPLGHAHVVSSDEEVLRALRDQKHLIMEELNVKDLTFNYDESQFVQIKPKPNFRVLGQKAGKHMKNLKAKIESLTPDELKAIMEKEAIEVALEDEVLSLTEEDILIDRQVHEGLVAACAGSITIALDTHITPELELEALAREIVNKVNMTRRNENFDVTDRIYLHIMPTEKIKRAFDVFGSYIRGETLTVDTIFQKSDKGTEWDLNGEMTTIYVEKSEATSKSREI